LYQAYVRSLAEYESSVLLEADAARSAKSPGSLRREEALVLKEQVLHALNNYHEPLGNNYSLERLNFFENAIDWKNLTFKLYNYGPNSKQAIAEKAGMFAGADDRRRAFLTALWAQVFIPLQPDERMERQLGKYFETGAFDLEEGFGPDDLAALYQEIVRDRERIDSAEPPSDLGMQILPTDLIIVRETPLGAYDELFTDPA
jgi:hypothetical protein